MSQGSTDEFGLIRASRARGPSAPRGRVIRDRVRLTAETHGIGRVILTAHGIDRTGVFARLLSLIRANAPWARLDHLGGGRVGEFFHAMAVVGHPDLRRVSATPPEACARVEREVAALVAAASGPRADFSGRFTAAADTARLVVTGPDEIEFPEFVFATLSDRDVPVRQAEWLGHPLQGQGHPQPITPPGPRVGVLRLVIGLPGFLDDAAVVLTAALEGRVGVRVGFEGPRPGAGRTE